MTNSFSRLQNWYSQQCNGDWEHQYGIKIETTDNPGWHVVIDLIGTSLEGRAFISNDDMKTEASYFCSSDGRTFTGFTDGSSLDNIFEFFCNWVVAQENPSP